MAMASLMTAVIVSPTLIFDELLLTLRVDHVDGADSAARPVNQRDRVGHGIDADDQPSQDQSLAPAAAAGSCRVRRASPATLQRVLRNGVPASDRTKTTEE